MGINIKKIALSGASGFIGTFLSSYLTMRGWQVVPLPREMFGKGCTSVLTDNISGCSAVINLAGAPINKRWTVNYKEVLYRSRIDITRQIVECINSLADKPEVFISASAVGYYPETGCHDEYSSDKGSGFLSGLCGEWEQEAQRVSEEVRSAITRFGVVFSPGDGAFPKLSLPARMGVSITFGAGSQNLPWIDIKDLVRGVEFILAEETLSGPVNFVSPDMITYHLFAELCAKHFNTFAKIRISKGLLQSFLGESSQFITSGQCVIPSKLNSAEFNFITPTIGDFFNSIS